MKNIILKASAAEAIRGEQKSRHKRCNRIGHLRAVFGPGLVWALKVTVMTFFICVISSMIANLATAKSNFVLAIFMLIFMIVISIIFDSVGVAVASCNYSKFVEKCKCQCELDLEIAKWLSKNAEKVNNICCDVVGDMCGTLSGACGVSIVVNICRSDFNSYIVSVVVSSIIASLTVGGKAVFKGIALSHSQKIVFLLKKILKFFWHKHNKQMNHRK